MGAAGQGGAPPRPAAPLRLVFAADTSPRALLAALPAFEKDVAALDAALLAAATRLESGVAAARKQLAEEAAKAEELIKTCVAAEQQRKRLGASGAGALAARLTSPHTPLPCPALPSPTLGASLVPPAPPQDRGAARGRRGASEGEAGRQGQGAQGVRPAGQPASASCACASARARSSIPSPAPHT